MTQLLAGRAYNRAGQYDAGEFLEQIFNIFATDIVSEFGMPNRSAPQCPLAALIGVSTSAVACGPSPCSSCGQHWGLRHLKIERSWMLYAKTVAESGRALASLVEGLLVRHCPTVFANAEADGALRCQTAGCPGLGPSSYIEYVVDLPPVLLLQIECQVSRDGSGNLQPCPYRLPELLRLGAAPHASVRICRLQSGVSVRYRLRGIMRAPGRMRAGGHYTALVRANDGRWRLYDDLTGQAHAACIAHAHIFCEHPAVVAAAAIAAHVRLTFHIKI